MVLDGVHQHQHLGDTVFLRGPSVAREIEQDFQSSLVRLIQVSQISSNAGLVIAATQGVGMHVGQPRLDDIVHRLCIIRRKHAQGKFVGVQSEWYRPVRFMAEQGACGEQHQAGEKTQADATALSPLVMVA